MELDQILKNKFKKQAFRPGQKEIIESSLAGKNIFGIIPTGGGKSLCYQFLAMLNLGQVLVISPLVALIDDQHKEAKALGLHSLKIHSNLSVNEKQKFYDDMEEAQILFMTPERLVQDQFWVKTNGKLKVQFLIVDEAHCLSQWGHDFRPDYTRIPDFCEKLGFPQVLALTATASISVKNDIMRCLSLRKEREWFEYLAPIERPNLEIRIFPTYEFNEKLQRIVYLLNENSGPKIIYFSLIQTLENVAQELAKLGIEFTKYHGQLPPHVKQKNQKDFFEDRKKIILATPAFGLGVNKPDIRTVIHFELPNSVEAFFQEVGRAGRDGLPSVTELFYSRDDAEIHMEFLKWSHPEPDFIYGVYDLLNDYPDRYRQEGPDFLREKLNFYNRRDYRTETSLQLLKRWEILKEDHQRNIELGPRQGLHRIPDLDKDLHMARKKSSQLRLLNLIQLIEKFKDDSSEIQKDIVDYFQK